MAGRIRGCFDTAAKLRSHKADILCQFLSHFPDFLRSFNIALPNPVTDDGIPYERIRDALMSPDIPDALAVILILADKLGNEKGWGAIEHEAGLKDIRLDFDCAGLSYSDRALMAWLATQPGQPDFLEESFARSRIYTRSSYTYYPMTRDLRAQYAGPDSAAIAALEAELDEYFRVEEVLGGGAKVLVYDYDAEIWFLVRHPGVVRRQGVYEHGCVKTLPLTPEHYDAVIYHKSYGDLRINSARHREHARYRISFGHALFNASNVFDPQRKIVSLRPLLGDCIAACNIRDIPGLHALHVSEITFRSGLFNQHRVTLSALCADTMLPLDRNSRALPPDAEYVESAKFRYRLSGDRKFKGLTVHAGKILVYERDGDSSVLETWLRERKYIDNSFTCVCAPRPLAPAVAV